MPLRDPATPLIARMLLPRSTTQPPIQPQDLGIVAALLALQSWLCVLSPEDARPPGLAGWVIIAAASLLPVARRRAPMLTVLAVACLAAPYHIFDYPDLALLPSELVALWSLAVVGPPVRSFLTLTGIFAVAAVVLLITGEEGQILPVLVRGGWIADVVMLGEAVRIHRAHVAAIVERAERAERTREREAARRVAEERVHIARDLHDLLAHSITLIGVQTSVAAHVLLTDPERLDRAALAKALDGIADTCRDARAELRATLEMLRANDPAEQGPLPGLDGLPDLVRAAEGAGARVRLEVDAGTDPSGLPPAVGAAAYRITQEALTNAVRHGGPAVGVAVTVSRDDGPGADGALRISVLDNGRSPMANEAGGYGIVGMRERARSVGGSLRAGPRPDGAGFAVTAVLPLAAAAADASEGSDGR